MLVEKLEEGPLPNTVEAYAKKLLDVGLSDGMLTDKKVSHNAVIGAQRLLIEKAKLKTQQDALKISMLKMMRGTFGEEGEVVDGRSRVIESNTD